MEDSITSHVKFFLGNKSNSYICTTQNARATFAKNIYEKIVVRRKLKGFQRRI